MQAPPAPPPPPFAPSYSIQFGVKSGGSIAPIGKPFTTKTANLQVAFDANTIATKRMRTPDASVYEALAEAKTAVIPAGATPPKLTPIWGYSFCKSAAIRNIEPSCALETSVQPQYDASVGEHDHLTCKCSCWAGCFVTLTALC